MLNNLRKHALLPTVRRWDSMFDSVMGKLDLFPGEELRSELDDYIQPDIEVTEQAVTVRVALPGYSKQEITDKTAEIIRILDMEKFADNRIEKLSTGQTQRASIARCLMADPQLYILDEPTLGLDIISADGIIRFMKEQKQKGKTVLYSTHYLEEAQELCNRIYMICQGRIVAEGTPEELMEKTGTNSLREAFHYIFNNLEDVEGGQKNE